MGYGIAGLLILALDIWALLGIWSSSTPTATKLVWTAVIILLPLIGVILWYFIGPKGPVST